MITATDSTTAPTTIQAAAVPANLAPIDAASSLLAAVSTAPAALRVPTSASINLSKDEVKDEDEEQEMLASP